MTDLLLTRTSQDRLLIHRTLRCQYEALHTLWTDGQTNTLKTDILSDLETEFGPMAEETLGEPVQHAVGWLTDNESDLSTRDLPENETLPGRAFDGLRICRCLGCGQCIAWRPSFGLQACGDRCLEWAFQTEANESARVQLALENRNRRLKKEKEKEEQRARIFRYTPKPYYVTIAVDPVAMGKIVDSLQRQLSERHNVLADFVKPHCVRGKWTVLEFSVRDSVLTRKPLYVIVNGSGLGRASWVLDVHSPEEAVDRTVYQTR
jgi:hypothetical protein